jgi:putative ABC transport system permease protein
MLHALVETLRRLRQAPGYATAVVLTFALAIGANSAIFSAVKAVLLRPLPVAAPSELAVIWQTDETRQPVIELTYRHLREWTERGGLFSHAAVMASHNWSAVLEGRGEPSRIWFNGVSAGFFDVLGARPLLGRTFTPDDDRPNAPGVAVLNHSAWMDRFGGDPAIVGQAMDLDGNSVEIVGVMPPGFDVPRAAEFWVPVVPVLASGTPPATGALDTVGIFYVVARMPGAVDVSRQARAIDAAESQLDASMPGRLTWGSATVVTPLVDYLFGPVRPALRILWVAVGVLLLVACANVSGLMLTRVAKRRHEHAIRMALGAGRLAIGRLWALEVVVLALAGALLGLVGARWLTGVIVALAPDDLPRLTYVAVDGTVALVTLAVVAAAAALTGIVPLREASRAQLTPQMDGERTTAGRAALRMRSGLVVVQIALAVVLLVSAGLVVRSFVTLRQLDLGFVPDRVLSVTVQPRNPGQPTNAWLDTFLARIRTVQGVESAGAVLLRPLQLGKIGWGARVVLEGQPETRESADANPTLNYQIATTAYFETLRIPLLAGRFFTDEDRAGTERVAIVSESTARRLWPGQEAIGRRFSMSAFTPGTPGQVWRRVVGVVSDVRYRGLDEVQLDVYDPALQAGLAADNVVIRTSGNPLAAAPFVTEAARALDATAIVDNVTSLDAVVRRAEAPWRLTTWMFVLFAGTSFALAALGLFGLVALDVTQRRREFAIRLALGEPRGRLSWGVIRRAGVLTAIGLAAGFIAATVVTRTMRHLLFGISPADGWTYGAVAGLVVLVVAAAAWIPARRASRVEPQSLLRV